MKRSIVSALSSMMVFGSLALSGCGGGGIEEGMPTDVTTPADDPVAAVNRFDKPGANKPPKMEAPKDAAKTDAPAAPDAGAAEKK